MKSANYTLSNLGTKLALYPIGFIASIFIARFLGPEEKGIFAYIVVLISFMIPITSLGIGSGFRFYVSNKEYRAKEVFFTVFVCALIIGGLNAGIIYLLWDFNLLGETGTQITTFQITLLFIVMIFNSLYFFLTRLGLGDSKFYLLNGFDLAKNILNPLFIVLFVFFFGLRIDGVLVSLLGLYLLLAIGLFFFMNKEYQITFRFKKSFIKKSMIYGIKAWIGDVSVRANVRLDQILLGGLVSAKSLGFYSVAVTLSEMLWIIPDSVGPVLFNKIASEQKKENQLLLVKRIHRLMMSLSLVLSIGWLIICKYLIIPVLYGTAFINSIVPLMILIPGALLYIPAKLTTKLLSGTGLILETSKATMLGSIISVILYFILIPKYGYIGAAIGSSIGYLFVSVFCLYYTLKHFEISIGSLFKIELNDFYWFKDQIIPVFMKSKK